MSTAVAPPTQVSDYVDSSLIDFDRSIFTYVSNVYPKDDSQVNINKFAHIYSNN